MQTTTTLNPGYLAACLVLAAKQDIRYYLNGVYVELGEKETIYVATDGHRMLIIRDDRSKVEAQKPGFMIVPREAIEMALREKHAKPVVGIELRYDDEHTANLEGRLGRVFFKPIEGKYPNWRTVVPKEITHERGVYQVRYVLDFHKAAQAAFGRDHYTVPDVFQNGNGAGVVLVKHRPEFLGILMPMRDALADAQVPEWARPPVAANESQAQAAAD